MIYLMLIQRCFPINCDNFEEALVAIKHVKRSGGQAVHSTELMPRAWLVYGCALVPGLTGFRNEVPGSKNEIKF